MSLNGALQIGRSGMVASQAGLQIAGNNMANAATDGYTRQVLGISPARGEQIGRGQFVGGGVRIDDVTRAVDTALQSRFRDALSQEQGSLINQRILGAIETIQNELTENDLSSLLSEFFNAFSELANNPEDTAVRSVVVQQAVSLTDRLGQMRADYNTIRDEVDRDLGATVEQANGIMEQLSQINLQIANTEQGVGTANALRDQRDQLVNELSKLMEISTVEQSNGAVDVFVGSTPIVLAGESRGLQFEIRTEDGASVASVRLEDDRARLDVSGGRIGALLDQRNGPVQEAITDLDTFASQLIFQTNRLHSQGQGQRGFASVTGTYSVEDATSNLNAVGAELPFRIENGSFFVHVTHAETGVRTTHQVNVDGDTMSLNDLVNEINTVVGVPNMTASITPSDHLRFDAASGFEISFSDDSSGALAALGINTFFTGHDASNAGLNDVVKDNPGMIAAGAGHVAGSNKTAIALANLQDASLDGLGNRSLRAFWSQSVNRVGVEAGAAKRSVESSRLVRESIQSQVQAVSGVSLDEEAINLLSFQRQFQAAARFISVIDETLQTLLSIA